MKKTLLAAQLLILSLCLQSCYYDVEEEIYPSVECNTTDITYSQDVLKIIQDNCYACHDQANNFGGITLEGYDALKGFALDGTLLGVIKHQTGFPPMPQDVAQLVECDIEKIEVWIDEGALNN